MRRLLTPGWLVLHVLTIVIVATFFWLGWWQLQRAGQGSANSVAYAVQWPLFALFTAFMWSRITRDALHPPTPPPPRAPGTDVVLWSEASAIDDEEDEELAAYNRYLRWLDDQVRSGERR